MNTYSAGTNKVGSLHGLVGLYCITKEMGWMGYQGFVHFLKGIGCKCGMEIDYDKQYFNEDYCEELHLSSVYY